MLVRHLVVCLLFLNVSLNVSGLADAAIPKPASGLKLLKSVVKSKDTLLEVTSYINITRTRDSPNCVQMLCKFICFNGKSVEIEKDILIVSEQNKHFCSNIEELRLYNYAFTNSVLSHGFMGNFSNKVEMLYIASSNITDVQAGAFARGRFREIFLENLRLKELRKDFFANITSEFSALSIIQKEMPLESVHSNFLGHVKNQIKRLTIQAGLPSIRNLTGGNYLLNSLTYIDFSNNDFGNEMEYTDFGEVTMIEHLDLSHSKLESLPSYLFCDITPTLDFLDLSYNKLKTISRTIFGWRNIPRDLRIYAAGNEWMCSCQLQTEVKEIFIYYRTNLFCSEPEWYSGWSVFDIEICGVNALETAEPTKPTYQTTAYNEQENSSSMLPSTFDEPLNKETTQHFSSTTLSYDLNKPNLLQKLFCSGGFTNISEHISQPMLLPLISFDVTPQESLRVDVVVTSPEKLTKEFGLVWFSKVTIDYYKMEINYNEYGLGCYNAISYVTTVVDLIPNTAYTFCMILKNHVSISPFSCKSIYVSGNLATETNVWLTRDMRKTGLSLVIFGFVMFLFAGIIMIYLLLKRKPILLKGSKRVTTMHNNSGDIVVLPKEKSAQAIKEKEEKLARFSAFSYSQKRRNSNDSVASYQSYINTNFYEVITSYGNLNHVITSSPNPNTVEEESFYDMNNADAESCYLTPLETVSSSENLVQYAEIPYRAQGKSSVSLPQVPADKPPLFLALRNLEDEAKYTQVGTFCILDSQL